MRATKIIFAALVVGLLVVPVMASAQHASSVWIAYDYATNSAQGNWKVPGDNARGSMLGSWDSWSNAAKTGPMKNLYCAEANVYEYTGGFHEFRYDPKSTSTWSAPGITNAGFQWAAYLITRVDPNMNTSSTLTRAALQLSIWEALYDYSPGYGAPTTGDRFSAGNFQINSVTSGNGFTAGLVRSTANSYLNMYQGQYGGGTVLHDGQDLLRVDVPEPGSLLLLGGVLLGAASLGWRRRSRS